MLRTATRPAVVALSLGRSFTTNNFANRLRLKETAFKARNTNKGHSRAPYEPLFCRLARSLSTFVDNSHCSVQQFPPKMLATKCSSSLLAPPKLVVKPVEKPFAAAPSKCVLLAPCLRQLHLHQPASYQHAFASIVHSSHANTYDTMQAGAAAQAGSFVVDQA